MTKETTQEHAIVMVSRVNSFSIIIISTEVISKTYLDKDRNACLMMRWPNSIYKEKWKLRYGIYFKKYVSFICWSTETHLVTCIIFVDGPAKTAFVITWKLIR